MDYIAHTLLSIFNTTPLIRCQQTRDDAMGDGLLDEQHGMDRTVCVNYYFTVRSFTTYMYL
jgi:hypothetical protein